MLGAITSPPTLDEEVYARLRRAIVEGALEPGQEVVVTTVASQLGVSRIPVMHACQCLVGEGFLLANPRKRLTVVPLTEESIVDGFDVLTALECLALELATARVTPRQLVHWRALNDAVRRFRRAPGNLEVNRADLAFHEALWSAAQRPYLFNQIRQVHDHREPARALARQRHDPEASAAQHRQMIDAVANGDVAAAQAALREHRREGQQRAIAALRERH